MIPPWKSSKRLPLFLAFLFFTSNPRRAKVAQLDGETVLAENISPWRPRHLVSI